MVVEKKGSGGSIGAQMIVPRDFLAHFIVGSFGGAISFLDRRRWSAGVRGHE
jgi:hypothetical protein